MTYQQRVSGLNLEVDLIGRDGNAFAVMGECARTLETELPKEGWEPAEVRGALDEFQMECMSGDYDNLLMTTMSWFQVA